MAELITTQDTTTTVVPQDTCFTLQEMYSLLNCSMVQAISLNDGRIMWLDEEGKFKAPHFFNSAATRLLHESGGMEDDYIAGGVLITSHDEVQ